MAPALPTAFWITTGSVHGRMRMTEQGETIMKVYQQGTATFELEQLQADVVSAFLREDLSDEQPELSGIMDEVVEASRVAWTSLIAEPGFITYWAESPPSTPSNRRASVHAPPAAPASAASKIYAPSPGCLAGPNPAMCSPVGTASALPWKVSRAAAPRV